MKKRIILAFFLTVTMLGGLLSGCEAKKNVETTALANKAEKNSNDAEKCVLNISVTADKGWDKDSTPAIAHIVSDDKKVDFYHAVSPDKDGGKGSSEVELEAGKYTVEFVSPLNKDGSAYEIYDTGKKQEVTIDATAKDDSVIECPMKQIPADKVTDEMVKDIVAKTKDAVDKGDASLKGDVGKTVLENLEKNVAANPNVTDETKKKTADAKETAKIEEKPEETAKTEAKTEAASSNNSASSNSSNEQASKPAHQHSWVAHTATRQVWVPNIVTVDDYQQQQVCVGTQVVCNCGAINPSREHTAEHLRKGEWDNTWAEEVYEWQNVKVGSHTEDHGSYITENYTDYYYCSCGATK